MNWLSAAIVILFLGASSFAQNIKLTGKLIEDGNRGMRPLPNTRIGVAGLQSGLTDSNGRFLIDLSRNPKEGERVKFIVEKPGWFINHPLDGDWNLPNIGLQNIQTLDVIIVPRGSKKLWTHARIEKRVADLSDQIAKLKKEGEHPKPIDFTFYLSEWADKYGFTPQEVKEAFDEWAKAAEKSEDYRTIGLREFYKKNFAAAAENFEKAAMKGEERLKRLNEQTGRTTLDTYEDWKLAGNAKSSEYKFREAVDSYSRALNLVSRDKYAENWAEATGLIGIAKRESGVRAEGEEGMRMLSESVDLHKQALLVYTPEQMPQDWATTQNNLGNALSEQGRRMEGEEGVRLLGEAVAAFGKALQVFTPEQSPQGWAMTQNNLGSTLAVQGNRASGEEGVQLLGKAIAAYKQAHRVYTREQLPLEWAKTQNNLGITLRLKGRRTSGEERMRLLSEAIAILRLALEVTTREPFPQEWAMTQYNLGAALADQASRASREDSVRLLNEAATAFKDVLQVYTRNQSPQLWAAAQAGLGNVLRDKGRRVSGEESIGSLNAAVAAYNLALEVNTRDLLPQDWAMTQNNLGVALREQGSRASGEERMRLLNEAATAFKQVLQVYTHKLQPQEWAMTQQNLASTLIELEDWANAAQCYVNVLQVHRDLRPIYKIASHLYQEFLFDFQQAFELNRAWIERHPDDLSALSDFAQKHFTTGRFDQCQQRISSLLTNEKLDARIKIDLRAIEIANLLALNKSAEVPLRLNTLIEAVASQKADFKVQWSVEGTKHFISQNEKLAASRHWLEQLFKAMEGENRDAIVAGLKAASASFASPK